MENNLYLNKQSINSRLFYLIGFIWNKTGSKIDKVLANYNINIAKFNILMVIKHLGGKKGLKQNEISDKLLVTPSNITKMLDKLEADNYITRNNKPGDKRAKIIIITEKGSALLDEIWIIYSRLIDFYSPDLNDSDKTLLLNSLSDWQNKINKN